MVKVSISSIVRSLVLSKPFIKGCLAEGIVNYSALARMLSDELEVRGIQPSHGAVKMALVRIREEIVESEKLLRAKLKRVLGSTVLQLQSDLVVVTVKKHAILVKIPSLVKSMEMARFFQILQGVNTFTFIISRENLEGLVRNVEKDDIVEILDNQAAIILISPREIVETPGVIALITSTLYENDINISQIVSCYNDTIVLIDASKAWEAYRVLEVLTKSMKA